MLKRDRDGATPWIRHVLIALFELDQFQKEQDLRIEEIEVRLGLRRRPPNPHADEIKFDF